MKFNKAKEWDAYFLHGQVGFGFTLYPYQFSLGASIKFWPSTSLRIDLLPLRIHFYIPNLLQILRAILDFGKCNFYVVLP